MATYPSTALAGSRRGVGGRELVQSPWILLPAFALVLVLLVDGTGLGRDDAVSGATVTFVSVAVGALPFVLIGAIVSGALAVLVPDRAFARVGRLPLAFQVPVAALGGLAFPVCECGSVPVARRLALRGLHPSAAIAFMLAAPILNPVVLASTAIAFRGRDATAMTIGRGGLGLLIAILGGTLLARLADPAALARRTEHAGCDHDHGAPAPSTSWSARARGLVDHTTADLLLMGRFVVAGAALAALVQTLVPASALAGLGHTALLGPLVLMLMAFVLALCSEADAFVAAAFSQFTPTAQLAFLVFGPLLDLKLTMLYGATFGRRFVAGVAVLGLPAVLAGCLVYGALAL